MVNRTHGVQKNNNLSYFSYFIPYKSTTRQHLAATAEMAEAETMERCPHVYITDFNEIIKEFFYIYSVLKPSSIHLCIF